MLHISVVPQLPGTNACFKNRVVTFTGNHVLCQFVAPVTLAQEGTNQVIAVVLTGALNIALVHIWNKGRIIVNS